MLIVTSCTVYSAGSSGFAARALLVFSKIINTVIPDYITLSRVVGGFNVQI